jgi:Acyl-CoA dehydrogenase, C-terminal domain
VWDSSDGRNQQAGLVVAVVGKNTTGGSASIYSERSPLDRALRDAETVCQHIVMQHKTLAMAGAMLLEADTPVLPYI